MSRMFYGSIDVSKIDKNKLFKGKKGNYCNVTIWLNDEVDNYGNIVSVIEGQTQEERTSGTTKNYLGNLKEHVSQSPEQNQGQQSQNPTPSTAQSVGNSEDETDDLPF